MKKSIIKFQIFIISLICCCNANAQPVFGSPEDHFTATATPTPASCSSAQLTTSGECCQGANSNNVGSRCCPTGIPLAFGSTTECCPTSETYFYSGTCHVCPFNQVQRIGVSSGNVSQRCCPTGTPLAFSSTTECCPASETYLYGGTCHVCPEATPHLYPTNNDTYNNLGWGGTCRFCPETAPWEYDGTCHNCPEAEVLSAGHCCPRGQVYRASYGRCAAPCNLYKIDFDAEDIYRDSSDQSYSSGTFRSVITSNNTGLNCLDRIFAEADAFARRTLGGYGRSNTRYYDDNYIVYLELKGLINLFNCQAGRVHGHLEDGAHCRKGTGYFDQNCKALTNAQKAAECGNVIGSTRAYWYVSSPISLVWDSAEKVGDKVSIVNFPLNPSENGKMWIWKASDKLPLLVYDPEHQGKINSATQLFGNWTFGGQKVASLVSGDNKPKSWNNGYAALETLDANYDGRISDNELRPLALWFDKNQDGISQVGEVKELSELGLKELYFKSAKTNALTKDVELSIGYKRVEAGVEKIGSSVDWYSDRSDNAAELYMKHINRSIMQGKDISNLNSSEDLKVEPVTEEVAANPSTEELKKKFTGIWNWSFDSKDLAEDKRVGVLLIKQDKAGKITGKSIVEAPVVNSEKLKSMVYFAELKGKITAKNQVQFSVFAEEGKVDSSAELSVDGETLTGKSVLTSNENQKTVSYSWTATRYKK